MSQDQNFLHTTHRTVAWFRKAFSDGALDLAAPFQRNPVWTELQKSYLIDTILYGYPIPELYMQDVTNEDGSEKHIVVDGQQRIRAVLEFVEGEYSLSGDDVSSKWRGLNFEQLGVSEKKSVFSYKFVVRILPPMEDEGVRRIFSRLNRNVVALNEQELRNATYWGDFIKTIQNISDQDIFWSDSGIFSANDHRRMLDQEFISELAIAYLHGPQNKKDRLDLYYIQYERGFEKSRELQDVFAKVTGEISQILPDIARTRWRKKSDFYTLFLSIAGEGRKLPFASEVRASIRERLIALALRVEAVLALAEDEVTEKDTNVLAYARNVSRAASDRSSRTARQNALLNYAIRPALGGELSALTT